MGWRLLWSSGPGRRVWPRGRVAGRFLCVMIVGAAGSLLEGVSQTSNPRSPTRDPQLSVEPPSTQAPDANAQMAMRQQKLRRLNFDAANAERVRQMTQAAKMLETMAIALEAEVENMDSTRFSQTAVRKADTIEKLAHAVKEKMKMTMPTN